MSLMLKAVESPNCDRMPIWVYMLKLSATRSLQDSCDRGEHGMRTCIEFRDTEAQSGSLQRTIGILRSVLPPAQQINPGSDRLLDS